MCLNKDANVPRNWFDKPIRVIVGPKALVVDKTEKVATLAEYENTGLTGGSGKEMLTKKQPREYSTSLLQRGQEEFYIQKCLICHYSGFFEAAYKEHWTSGQIKTVWLHHLPILSRIKKTCKH